MADHMEDDWLAAIDEIVALTQLRPRQPGDFTTSEYQERLYEKTGLRIADATARQRLSQLVRQGVLASAFTIVDGKRARVYWKAHTEGLTCPSPDAAS